MQLQLPKIIKIQKSSQIDFLSYSKIKEMWRPSKNVLHVKYFGMNITKYFPIVPKIIHAT